MPSKHMVTGSSPVGETNLGSMAEWLNATVLKIVSRRWLVGSNPTASANNIHYSVIRYLYEESKTIL